MLKYFRSKSLIICYFITLSIIAGFLYNPRQSHDHYANELGYDIYGYYIYLPLLFIYHDIKLQKYDEYKEIFKKYEPSPTFYQVYKVENGNFTMNYTAGFAMLYAPFFFIAHFWASHSAVYPADGHSFPYHICIALGILLVYVIPGIYLLRKLLLKFFNDNITSAILLIMIFGTNYLNETVNGYMGPHAILFTAYTLFLLLTIKWHAAPRKSTAAALGFLSGIMILSRPSEILCLIILGLWNVWDKDSWNKKWQLIKENKSHIFIYIICMFLVGLPQMIYWKVVTGSWVINSYQNTEGFDFLKPHFLNVLFSFKKSWFIYTPVIIFPIIGIFLLRKYNKPIYYPILIFFLINFYWLGSKSAWWEGGSYGMRYFVESYAIMAIPLGYTLTAITLKKWYLKIPTYTLITFFVLLNLFQTWQYLVAIIPAERMTFAYYKAIFFKTHVTQDDINLMEVERSYGETEMPFHENEYNKRTIGFYNYETINTSYVDLAHMDTSHYLSSPNSCRLDKDYVYSPGVSLQYKFLTHGDHAWIRPTLHYFPVRDLKENKAFLVIHIQHKTYNNKYAAYDLSKYPYKLNEWNTFSVDYMTPYPYHDTDELKVYVWLQGSDPIYIDDFNIECFEKR